MPGKKGLKQESEKDLMDKLQAVRLKNQEDGVKEIQAILEKRNLVITTNVEVHLNGQPIGIVIKSK